MFELELIVLWKVCKALNLAKRRGWHKAAAFARTEIETMQSLTASPIIRRHCTRLLAAEQVEIQAAS